MLGTQIFQVQKWPAGFNSDAERRRRPCAGRRSRWTTRTRSASRSAASTWSARSCGTSASRWSYKGEKTNANVSICGGTPEYAPNNTHYVGLGRNLSHDGRPGRRRVAVIGYAIAEAALPVHRPDRQGDPARRPQVRGGRRLRREEVGVRRHYDNYVLIPISDLHPAPTAGRPRRLRALGQHHRAGEDPGAARRRDRGDPAGAAPRARRQARRGGQLRLLHQRAA